MRARREKYFSEKYWAKSHGIDDPSEEFLASVHKRNVWALGIIVPLMIAVAVTWFGHHYVLCAVVIALIGGVFLGLYIASKA
jgi:uncharacterized membrane protein